MQVRFLQVGRLDRYLIRRTRKIPLKYRIRFMLKIYEVEIGKDGDPTDNITIPLQSVLRSQTVVWLRNEL
jgi:hypothetical protein